MSEGCVVIESDLAIERDDRTIFGLDQRIDFDERRILFLEDLPKEHQYSSDLCLDICREGASADDLKRLALTQTLIGIEVDASELLGSLMRNLFDIHSTGDGCHHEE